MPRQGAPGTRLAPSRRKRRHKPSAIQRARSQERSYRSQGVAVKRVARRQTNQSRISGRRAFGPLKTQARAFRPQQKAARRRTRTRGNRIPRSTAIPRIPVLRHYTPKQRKVIRRTYKRAAKRAGVRNILGLYDLGSPQQKREMSIIGKRVGEQERRAGSFATWRNTPFRPSPGQRKTLGLIPSATIEQHLAIPGMAAGSTVRLDEAARRAALPLEAAVNIGRAFVEEPAATSKSSLRTLRESIAGIPQGVKMMLDDPEKALKLMADDYERRYGALIEDPAKFRKMVQDEYGVTPFALDAAALAGGTGQAAGAVARTGTFGRLTSLPGKAGQAARVLHEASRADVERPRLRFSGGEEGTRAQHVSRNLFVALGQRHGPRISDRARRARYRKGVERAGYRELPTGEMRRIRRGAKPDRLPALRAGPGEVVGRGFRDLGPTRRLTGRIERQIGSLKSTTRIAMLTHRGRVLKEVNRHLDKLTDSEKLGAAMMLRLGVKPNAEGIAALERRLAQIETSEAQRARIEGNFDDAESDAIKEILADPEEFLTARARHAASELRDIQQREAGRDPSLADDQELIRRYSQQAEFLDVPRRLKDGTATPDIREYERMLNMLEDSAEQQRKIGMKGGTRYQAEANVLREKIERMKRGEDPDMDSPDTRETVDDAQKFAERTRQAAEEAGLDEPAYWMSTADVSSGSRLRATGSGLGATERNRAYKGSLFRIGAESPEMDVFVQGVERNIKRRFQWQMVARNIETHAYEWSRGDGGGMTFSQLKNEMRRRAIDEDTVDFIPATIVKRRDASEAGLARGRPLDEVPEGEEFADVHAAIRERRSFEQLDNEDVQGAPMFRYFAVPKEVGETLEAATKPSNAGLRMFEIVMKQKPTRIMLGALNVPWLGFQVASNAMLTGLGGGLKPWDVFGAHKWFRGLDPEVREAVEAELGITHGHHFALDQPHLGDAKVPVGIRHLSAFYRGYKKTKVGRFAHKANPLDFMFRMDEAQNNFFRKSLFYSKAKKDAYRRMGRNWRAVDGAQQKVIDRVFKLPPDKMLESVIDNADLFEKHATHVRDWLGDYTRFSNAERKLLQANVLFYGYLRFSLRFAFYTMPVQHPIMADIAANIGRLGAQDVKRLFGVPSNYGLPTSMLAQVYSGKDPEHLKSVNYGRMNPFLNAVTQLESEQQAIGLVSPLYQALADQAFEESSFTGREWRIEGKPTPGEAERPPGYFGSFLNLFNPGAYSIPGVSEGKPRNRILQGQLLGMAFPYRVAEQTGIPGLAEPLATSQSDDALLWEPRPMGYKDEEAMAGVQRSRRQQRRMGSGEALLGQVLPPLSPRPTAAPQVIQRRREQEADQRNRSTGRRKRRSSPYGSGSSRYGGSSSGRYGGSSSSRYGR